MQLAQPLQQLPDRRTRVVIIGGGFAGIHAAKSLAHLPVDVTIIDRRNHHTFQPLLYQVALAVLSPADIASPIRGIVRHQKNTQVLMDEVVGFDTLKQLVSLKSGAQISYDYLVVAAGSTHSYFGHDEWAAAAPGLKTIEDATEIRRRVLLAFELAERHMQEHGWHPPLNFVVIGGGPRAWNWLGQSGTLHSTSCGTTSGTLTRRTQRSCCSTAETGCWPLTHRI
jgi:NADH dehydrogenase